MILEYMFNITFFFVIYDIILHRDQYQYGVALPGYLLSVYPMWYPKRVPWVALRSGDDQRNRTDREVADTTWKKIARFAVD